MQIPSTYRLGDNDYITIPVLKKFCIENKIKISSNSNRIEIVDKIEKFGSENNKNQNIVFEWVEQVLKMGIKNCLLTKIVPLDNNTNIKESIIRYFKDCPQKKICESKGENELTLANYTLKIAKDGKLIKGEFVFLIKLVKARGAYENAGDTILYPIFTDVDFLTGFMISRAKSSSRIFKVGEEPNLIDVKKKTSAEALMRYAEGEILNVIHYKREDTSACKNAFEKAIFRILDQNTKTPGIIQEKIDKSKILCKEFADKLFDLVGIEVVGEDYRDALYDLKIFVEKYSSITCEDRSIFMEDRCAYPIKFSTLDNEFTKIQEGTSRYDPLQSKKAFFDSKKVVYTNKKCDTIMLCYERKAKKYYSDKSFLVSITRDKGSCLVKFTSFVEEGDIQNVLSRVIQEFVV